MTSHEFSQVLRTGYPLTRQGSPCFVGAEPAMDAAGLRGADAVILGIPFVSPIIGYENDVAPRKVRQAGLFYLGSYVPEVDVDPAETLRIVDWGDVDFPFGDTPAAMAAVEAAVGAVTAAGAIPVTIGGNAPPSAYSVARAIAAGGEGSIGLINFDGHTDTMADYGDEPNSSNWVRAAYLSIPQLSPANHLQIGLRSMNNRREDIAFFRDRGMRVVFSPEVRELGGRRLAEEAVRHATAGTDRLWLGVDLDCLDSSQTPDWDWPDPNGLVANDILQTAWLAGRSGKLCGVSLMMIGGSAHSVQRIAVWIVLWALAGVAAARAERG